MNTKSSGFAFPLLGIHARALPDKGTVTTCLVFIIFLLMQMPSVSFFTSDHLSVLMSLILKPQKQVKRKASFTDVFLQGVFIRVLTSLSRKFMILLLNAVSKIPVR